MGFTGVYIIFHIFAQKRRLWIFVRTASASTTIYVLSRTMENIRVLIWKFSVFGGEIFYIFEKACFRNVGSSSHWNFITDLCSSSLEPIIALTPTLFKCSKLHVNTLLMENKLTDLWAIKWSFHLCIVCVGSCSHEKSGYFSTAPRTHIYIWMMK